MKKRIGALVVLMCMLMCTVAFGFNQLTPDTNVDLYGLDTKANTILGMVQWIGFVVGTAMIIYIGIKYITAGAGQKAEVKSTMVPLLVGAILVMIAPTLAVWIFSI